MPGCRLRPPPWLGISSSLGPLPPPLALEPPHTLLLPLHDQHDTRRQGRGCTELQAKSNMSAHPNQASSRLARNRARDRTLARMVAGCGQSEPLRGLLSLWRLARSRGRSTLQPISTEHVHYRSHLVSIRPHTDGWERSTSRGCDTDAMEDRGGEASTSWQVFRQRTLHAAAGDSAGDGQQRRCPAAQPLPGNASRTLLTALTKSSHTATLRAGHLCPWPTWLPRQRRRLASRGRKSGSRRACARPPQPCLSVPARAAWQRRPPPSVRAPLTLGALQAQAEGGAGQGEP